MKSKRNKLLRAALTGIFSSALAIWSGISQAQGFGAFISPSRFELEAKPGEVLRQYVNIGSAGEAIERYSLRTVDWTMDAKNGIVVQERLQPGSCRPWVALERKTLQMSPGGGLKRYRFEVRVPADTAPVECRFGILVESAESQASAKAGKAQIPVTGRIVIIVYLAVGGVKPNLSFEGLSLPAGEPVQPRLTLRNTGMAHGRPQGLLDAVDGSGKKLNLLISPLPVLPGERRTLPVYLKNLDGSDFNSSVQRPLKVKGLIEWDGGSQQVDTVLH